MEIYSFKQICFEVPAGTLFQIMHEYHRETFLYNLTISTGTIPTFLTSVKEFKKPSIHIFLKIGDRKFLLNNNVVYIYPHTLENSFWNNIATITIL